MDERLMGRLLAVVVSVVTVGWFLAFVVAPILRPDFHPAIEINVPMMAVIGLFLNLYRKAKNPQDVRESPSPVEELTKRVTGREEDRRQ